MNENKDRTFLEAGRIVNTHGLHGEVKIQPWADSAEFLQSFRMFYLESGKELSVISSRTQKGFLYAKFDGVDDVEKAQILKGKIIKVDRNEIELPEGTYLLSDVIGAKAVTEDGQELGLVKDILEEPAANVFIIRGDREILVPAVPEFLLNVDTEQKVVTVRLIEGM